MAVDFNAVDNYIEVPGATDPTAYTICGWIRCDSDGVVIVRANSGGPTSGWSHEIYVNTSGVPVAYLYDGSGRSVVGSTNVTGAWHHVLATAINGGTERLFVDGKMEGSPISVGTMDTTTDRWRIGQDSGQADDGGYFDGLIEDIRVYHRVLSAAEIKVLAAGYRGPLGGEYIWLSCHDFQGIFHPDGATLASANIMSDLSGNGNDGTPRNNPVARASEAPRF